MKHKSIILERQKPLMAEYLVNPAKAWITDEATIEGQDLDDPFHSTVKMNGELQRRLPVGVHRAVGGLHDSPNPGDILCTALASCFETTLRMVANRLGVPLLSTRVKATAEVDVRGTLMLDREVPVAFQKMTLKTQVEIDGDNPRQLQVLLRATENSCVVLQTLKNAVDLKVKHHSGEPLKSLIPV